MDHECQDERIDTRREIGEFRAYEQEAAENARREAFRRENPYLDYGARGEYEETYGAPPTPEEFAELMGTADEYSASLAAGLARHRGEDFHSDVGGPAFDDDDLPF